MQDNGFIRDKDQINDALRRNKRLGKKHSKVKAKAVKPTDLLSSFLRGYIFDKLNMSPMELVNSIENIYYSKQDFINRRQRNIDFTRGRNFNEPIYDPSIKRTVTMFQYLKRRGIPHLTYNVVSKLLRSLVGQFREINTGNVVKCESKDERGQELANILTECLSRIKSNNKAKSKDSRNMKEMLLSGVPVFKVLWGNSNNMTKDDVRFREVNTIKYGENPGITDEDKANLHTAYEIHDTDLDSIINLFANGDYERGMRIRQSYISKIGDERKQASYSSQFGDGSELRNFSFSSQGAGNSSYRYIEVWVKVSDYEAATYDPLEVPGNDFKVFKYQDPSKIKKQIEEVNQERIDQSEGDIPEEDLLIQLDVNFRSRWYVTYLTPWGEILDVRESPYKNGIMPYVTTVPGINGEAWGLIEEVLDAQLSMDRQIRQADEIISNASKGVWMVPSNAVPDDMSPKEYLNEIKKPDGAVIVQIRDNQPASEVMPKQMYANAANVSSQIQQMIQLYSGLVDEISGNYGAAQGKQGNSNTTATGYALESQNAGLNIRDTFETYLDVLVQRDELLLALIKEGYTKQDYAKIIGEEVTPAELKQFDFSIEQSKGTNSPQHRLALEQEMLQLVYNQLLPFEVYLEITNNPVLIQAKQKLQEFNKKKAMEGQQQIQGAGGDIPQAQNGMMQPTAQNPQVDAEQIAGKQIQKAQSI